MAIRPRTASSGCSFSSTGASSFSASTRIGSGVGLRAPPGMWNEAPVFDSHARRQ
jgi:hypothetical protein